MSESVNTKTDMATHMTVAIPPDSPRKPVKSTAVVKYSAVHTPATYAQLQCNTDLNLPPSNWLSSSAESYGLQSVWSQTTGFSSFRMAHMFPDCVGEVDVVSDAENIKKLLKLPYNHGVISMMVHRIENTLLLDDFDIHKYLLRQAESDWEWLKKFFYEHIFQSLGEKEKRLFHQTNSRSSLKQRNLVSKFLYHSIVLADNKEQHTKPQLPVKTLEPCLPEPSQEEKVPDPNYNHNFARNIVWTFENIHMLIGTDMPIFGGQTHPCISLRLRDMAKPINVLTGIDYWLDNLMCNVPEVVMCYHLDGIVQKYELIKTEDLPNLEGSKFSPKVIRDVAQNILSFLKNNATKAGHTYWLFKGKDDDVVKLYDLTSLCNDVSEEKGQNPFTVPVAMLLYRVARNMKYSADCHRHQGTIRMLLRNCVELLAKEKYPQIVTSAHFMLSDLYIPSDTDPSSPRFLDQSDEEDTQSETSTNYENDKEDDEETEAIKSLTLANIREHMEREELKFKPPPIIGSIEERCSNALEHVQNGLQCLQYFPRNDGTEEEEEEEKEEEESRDQKKGYEYHQNVAKPYQAIPMPYAPLNAEKKDNDSENNSICNSPTHRKKLKQKKKKVERNLLKEMQSDNAAKALLCKMKTETLPTWQAPKKSDNTSWNAHLRTLLYEKAALIYAVLAEFEYGNKNYGASLRHMLAVRRCQKILEVFCGIKNDRAISYLLGRAGDCCFMTVQNWSNIERHRKDYEAKQDAEEKIIENVCSMEELLSMENGTELLPVKLETIESTLVASHKCYEKALALEPMETDRNNLLRRLGNINNELGVLYMNQAASRYQEENGDKDSLNLSSSVSTLLTRSLTHLEAGVKAFETVHDEANLALLHSNTGRLMRVCAHMHDKQNAQERQYYHKALASYQKALQVLGTRKSNPVIWDTVTWDLTTTLLTMATLLQDYPVAGYKTEDELERELVDILQKALKHCDTESPGPRQPVYQFRAAAIQHRLASLYHRIYIEIEPDADNVKRKTSLQLCKLYYDKTAKLFFSLEQTREFLTVQLERVALAEHQARNATTVNGKIKAYQNALMLILQCKPMLEISCERNKSQPLQIEDAMSIGIKTGTAIVEEDKGVEEQKLTEDEESLVVLLEQRLQFLLKSLTKLFLTKSNSSKESKEFESLVRLYKQCYSRTLRPGSINGAALTEHVTQVLKELGNMLPHTES